MRHGFSIILVCAASLVSLWGTSPYHPRLALQYANQHWSWTESSGGLGWATLGRFRVIRRQVPGSGWFQPDFQCAEFVGRSLAAGGIALPLVSSSNPSWPILVNVDCQTFYLISHGYANYANRKQLKIGDVALFRYNRLGMPPSPTYWSHMALVVHVHPLLLDAHNAAHYNIVWRQLDKGALGTAFLEIHAVTHRAHLKWHVTPLMVVQVHYRNISSITKHHMLYRNQIYQVAAANPWGQVSLKHIAGQYWQFGLIPLASPPPSVTGPIALKQISWPSDHIQCVTHHHGKLYALGISPHGYLLLTGDFEPVPEWTGKGSILETRQKIPSPWHLVTPHAVTIVKLTRVYALPAWGSPILAVAPVGTVTVMDAQCLWHHHRWAQVEWQGAHMGVGYIPEKVVRTEKLPLVPAPVTVKTAAGPVTINKGTLMAEKSGQLAYAGAWLLPLDPRRITR